MDDVPLALKDPSGAGSEAHVPLTQTYSNGAHDYRTVADIYYSNMNIGIIPMHIWYMYLKYTQHLSPPPSVVYFSCVTESPPLSCTLNNTYNGETAPTTHGNFNHIHCATLLSTHAMLEGSYPEYYHVSSSPKHCPVERQRREEKSIGGGGVGACLQCDIGISLYIFWWSLCSLRRLSFANRNLVRARCCAALFFTL